MQSSQLHFQEQHINDGLEDEILFGALDGDDDCNMNGIEDLFGSSDWDSKFGRTFELGSGPGHKRC